MKYNEKEFLIDGGYQHLALTRGFYIQRNWHENKLNLLFYLKLINKNKLVDIGSGSGCLLAKYSSYFTTLFGIDNRPHAIQYAKKLLKNRKNIFFKLTDLLKVSSNNENIVADLLVCMEVIEHFTLDDLQNKVFKNIKTYMNQDSYLIITTPNRESIWPLLEFILDKLKLTPPMINEQHQHIFNKVELLQLLKLNGFKIVKTGTFNHLSPYIPFQWISKVVCAFEVKYLKTLGPLIYTVVKLQDV